MKIEDRILFFENGSPCIFFPVGSLSTGGSCEFITKKCLENCPSCGVVHEHELRAFKYFKDTTHQNITLRILEELNYFESTFMGWFSWGDCPSELIDKVVKVIKALNKKGIVQNGFTRNKKLWEQIPCLPNLRFSFSIDNIKKAKEASKDGIICCPDISRAEARVFYKEDLKARCSGYFCTRLNPKRTVEADCNECYKEKVGCFYNK